MRFGLFGGVALLATGRGRGIERFGRTPQAFLASLAPLLAFPLVGAGLLALSGRPGAALLAVLWTLVTQLAPPVVSHALAVRWGREELWLRYATAFNWCQWAIPVAGFLLVSVIQVGGGGRLSEEDLAQWLILGFAAYGLWLHWVLARNGLALGRGRAVGAVLLINAATLLLVLFPRLLRAVIG